MYTIEELKNNLMRDIPIVAKAVLHEDIEMITDIVSKVNSPNLHSICMKPKGSNMGMVMYVEYIYEGYEKGEDTYQNIIYRLLNHYRQFLEKIETNLRDKQNNINEVLNKPSEVFLEVIPLDTNKEVLKELYYIPFLDFAIVFRYLISENKELGEYMTTLMNLDQIRETFPDMAQKEIYQFALQNTIDKNQILADPITAHPPKSVIDEIGCSEEDFNNVMTDLIASVAKEMIPVILTTNGPSDGTVTILLKEELIKIAQKGNCNLILTPANKNYYVVYADSESNRKDCKKMLQLYLNEIDSVDQFTKSIYGFNKDTNEITILDTIK